MELNTQRLRIALGGAVQGVGFRPFVYRLATELGLGGWVRNSGDGLVLEVEGGPEQLVQFQNRLKSEKPAAAVVLTSETTILEYAEPGTFEICASDPDSGNAAGVLPDLSSCPACLSELRNPTDRRHGYAFINCTNCGPRYTIIEDIPYDRPGTTMSAFTMCRECRREYDDPFNRRFHAQPNACPACGPRLWAEAQGAIVKLAPIECARQTILGGGVVALRGIGGFQLVVDARQAEAVARLRVRKRRDEKPFALMMRSLEMVREYCHVSAEEELLLASAAAPIVLLRPRGNAQISSNVARSSPYLGVMLPYSPLHHLLMEACPFPLVATSGNLSDEPIAVDNDEARTRLGDIADLFVLHDRRIARPCDDSVARVVRGRTSVMRRARGYAPLPVFIGSDLPPVLAVGGHLKSAVAIAVGGQVVLSQHIGDLDTLEARFAFEHAISDLCRLHRFEPKLVACDIHPDYASTRWALASGLPVVQVQHHQAHVAACAAENGLRGPHLGVAWDGTGYGTDGAIWGGEFFLVDGAKFERIAHLRPFQLPGGEIAVRHGWRSAASLLVSSVGPEAVPERPERAIVLQMLARGLNAPWTTSVGRLFDAVASIAGVADQNRFEGQAAMLLERAVDGQADDAYPLEGGDWAPMIEAIRRDVSRRAGAPRIATRFHNALANWIVSVACQTGVRRVALSGGVFQNRYLVERTVKLLGARGLQAFTHEKVPPNDGGIALGQVALAALRQGE